ncbi:structural cement protein Gp24 [Providencia stuartii]|nr:MULTISPECIES: hypothetical protein [Providencia]MBN5562945.1 hypothetical protein [Providencia stuartii]MDE8745609.1 hypothetical protein [Providencia thailandensis]MDE8764284.1 hypothetical protein [Providencia thailandensis]MDE8776662.1 hypothetical protein [Providencia thailandensis]MDE8780652.1 hypothetical protein [Providencia thailandensis]
MSFFQTNWDSPIGTLRAGTIYRASSSNDKVWGEENRTEKDMDYGIFVAVNPEGGVKHIETVNDVVHGIVVRDIYGDKAPHSKTTNVGHFSHGDCVGALAIEGEEFTRGDLVYIKVGGDASGRVTKEADGNIFLGYWAEKVSKGSNCVAITLGYMQNVQQTGSGE